MMGNLYLENVGVNDHSAYEGNPNVPSKVLSVGFNVYDGGQHLY